MNYEDEMKLLKEYEMEKAFEELNKIMQENEIPKKLFRYRPLNMYTADELIHQHVFLASPDIDDIFDTSIVNNGEVAEGSLAAYYFTKNFRHKDQRMASRYEMYSAYFEELNNKLRENVRIACFTESNTNVPMWQYYADKNAGICIEYSIDVEKIKSDGTRMFFLPIIYTNDYNKYFPFDVDDMKKSELTSVISSVLKMEDWKFEKEWRIIALNNQNMKGGIHVNLDIEAIYFGINTPNPIKSVIKGMVNEKILLYEMRKELTGLEEYEMK